LVAGELVAGTGDFNGDAKSDIVWRDTSGNTSISLMNGAALLASAGIGNIPTTFSIVDTGDFNGGIGNIPPNWAVQSTNAE
jgi:hypothetical protein